MTTSPRKISPAQFRRLMNLNPDSKQYFYAKADESWAAWLWKNGFLELLKEKSTDPSRYSFSSPELAYLERIAGKDPGIVTEIILDVPISLATFNPEVIDRFSRICGNLPALQLKRLVNKIRDEGWIPLMGGFNQFGFEYERMLKILSEAKEYDGVLILAQAILALRSTDELLAEPRGYPNERPFYFNDLEYTKVFEYLAAIEVAGLEKALEFVLSTLQKVILKGKSQDERVFEQSETFHLYDVDFFDLDVVGRKHGSYRDDVHSLAATVKILLERPLADRCHDTESVKSIYAKHIAGLPDSYSFWRLRLFVLSLCPQAFKDELKTAFFRIFLIQRHYHELTSNEYLRALQKGFGALDESDKRAYVDQVFLYFGEKVEDQHVQQWQMRDGHKILSCICEHLTQDEKEKCMKVFGQNCGTNFKIESPAPRTFAGTVRARGPITAEEFSKLPITDIVAKMQSEWEPSVLRPQNKPEDFLHPLNAEGVGLLLKEDLPKRLQDYITSAELFFKRDHLDPHYTYALIRGIEEILREKKVSIENINWDGFIQLCLSIKESGEKVSFENQDRGGRDVYGGWLSGWVGVHSVMADVLLKLASENDGGAFKPFEKYRDNLLSILQYLFSIEDPTPADEKIDTAKHKIKSPGQQYELGDPFTAAINSVRGRAFQVLTNFIYLDGQKYPKEATIKIADDVKNVYEELLKRENTQAIMFMFGHYLASFYYRDIVWIRGLLSLIFPAQPEKHDLYLAAWEGYLATSLYEEMFSDPEINKLYYRAIDNNPEQYTKRRHVKELDDGLAVHLALAFIHYDNFAFESDLFKTFWSRGNSDRFGGFISFIGRAFVSGDNKRADEVMKNEATKEKMRDFWDWALENCMDATALKEFGFWMNTEKGVFDLLWQANHIRLTLEKTNGVIEWDYGLMRSISTFAKNAPVETLAILRLLLLVGGVRAKRISRPFYMENESYEAFTILYQNGDVAFRKEVYELIDDLIREGGSAFWKLKDVLSQNGEQV